ncbi:type II secretion system F family protein, partial [Candidatus Gracilibacteria bacterium]|nr:type II secretion system F family protein [Candidatus Gracilibacteria bacterium]
SGEQTGMMGKTFAAIAREMRMQEDLRRKVYGALAYPFIIFLFLLLAIAVVMIYVIPQIMPMITEMTTDIPWTTASLIWVSNFMKDNIFYIIGFLVAWALIFYAYVSTPNGRKWIDTVKMQFPIVGKVYKNYMVVQVMDTFGLLMSSGVSILRSLKLTGSSSGNAVIILMFESISKEITAGKRVSEGFKSCDPYKIVFTSDILQMIESAEKTSTVDATVLKIGEQYRREVDSSLAVLVKFVEPAALLGAGIFVLWFAVAIFSAIMQVVAVSGA